MYNLSFSPETITTILLFYNSGSKVCPVQGKLMLEGVVAALQIKKVHHEVNKRRKEGGEE